MGLMKQTQPQVWSTRRLLAWTADHFAKKRVDSPRLAAEMLLSHVLGVPRLKLYMDLDRPASALERATLRRLVERAADHEPVDYLVGQAPFFSMMFTVCPDVLIPRPSTEAVVEHVIHHARRTPGFSSPLVADIGTGSGVIAVALAKHLPHCRVVATDTSSAALEIAQANAQAHHVTDRIDFKLGDLFEPLCGLKAHYLVSNPPYISDAQWRALDPNVKLYEPPSALRGGADGLKYLRPLIQGAHGYLNQPGQLVLEIGFGQKQAVQQLTQEAPGLTHSHVLADHEGLPRVLVADGA